jgi:hypothetical protein
MIWFLVLEIFIQACFMLAALCGMLLAATAMTFDDDDIDELADLLSQDPSAMARPKLRPGCGWSSKDDMFEEPLTADEIDNVMQMLDPQGGRGGRGGRDPSGKGGLYGKGERGGRGSRGNDGRGSYNTDIFEEPATAIDGKMMRDPLWGWGGWGRPWGGWGGWGRRWGGWGRRGWGGRYFDSDDNQEMQEEPETTADDLEDMILLDPQGRRGYRGGDRDRYRGDRDRYRGDRDRYRGDRDRYRGDRDRYRGDRDRYRKDRY